MTRLAQRQRDRLRGAVLRSYTNWLSQLKREGCRAMDYRMTGGGVEHLCVKHLRDNWRAIVAFHSRHHAVLLLLGQHLDRSPELDVYTQLYRLADIDRPDGQRTKLPCCDGDTGHPCSPRTRGWAAAVLGVTAPHGVLPTHAKVGRTSKRCVDAANGAPHAREGGPFRT
ncbi:hypothetical protein GCM10023222_58160 [Saccharopolyspora cebuensis]